MDIYQFDGYKDYIRAMIEEQGTKRGYRSQLATEAGCHTSFLSQVLNSHVHLTPDQALGLAQFWSLSSQETDFFLSLVHLERSSSTRGLSYYRRQIQELRCKAKDLSQRVQNPEIPVGMNPEVYYSSWYHAAIFVLISLPEIKTIEDIKDWLGLPLSIVQRVVKQLLQMELIAFNDGELSVLHAAIHLPRSSTLNTMNHMNWRSFAMQRLQCLGEDDLNFSAVFTHSKADRERIAQLCRELIGSLADLVGPSVEEDASVLLLDFCGLKN